MDLSKYFQTKTARDGAARWRSRARTAVGAAMVAALAVCATAANAANSAPVPASVAMPFSWPQFMQSYGTTGTTAATVGSPGSAKPDTSAYSVANPGALTKVYGTALSVDWLTLTGQLNSAIANEALDPGTELRAFLLGDYASAASATSNTEPPSGPNNFRDIINNGAALDPTKVASWVAPLYATSNLKNQQTAVLTVDDSSGAPTFGAPAFSQVMTSATGGQVGSAVQAEYVRALADATGANTATWNLTAPSAGTFSIWVNIPTASANLSTFDERRISDATYTVTVAGAAVATSGTVNQTVGGWASIAASAMNAGDAIVVTLSTKTAGATGADVYVVADAVQLRQATNLTIDDTDPGFTQPVGTWTAPSPLLDLNYYGSDYLTVAPTNKYAQKNANGTAKENLTGPNYGTYLAATAVAQWQTTVAGAGIYSVSVYFPSQQASGTGGTITSEDFHVSDAHYVINMYAPGVPTTGVPSYSTERFVDQTNGGFFLRIGGPFAIPSGTTVQILLDNGIDPAKNPTIYTVDPNTGAVTAGPNTAAVVCADAVQIQPDTATVSGSAVAVNCTAANGATPAYPGDYPEIGIGYTAPTGTGGGPVKYVASQLNSTTHVVVGGTLETHENTTSSGSVSLAAGDVPIAQVVYFTRTENEGSVAGVPSLTISSPGLAQASGSLYAVDGLNGNIIWRFGSESFAIDDADTANFATPATFASTAANFTGSGAFSAATTTPDTGFYGVGYRSATAVAQTTPITGQSTAQWTLPLAATSGPAKYYVYVWYPTAGTGETHVTDARYTVCGVDTTGAPIATPIQVNQQANGGSWQLIQNPATTDHTFYFSAGNSTVVLDNTTGNSLTPTPPVVVGDAVLFIPADAPSATYSTPLIVRNMKVITQYNAATGATSYGIRTVAIFSDSSGKVFCVDAAGNGDGDDTIVDQNGNPVSFDASGNPTSSSGNPLTAPYTLSLKRYGTTSVYWVWQPDGSATGIVPTAVGAPTKLYNPTVLPPGDSKETAPDSLRDMPAPGPFQLNSPTVALLPDTTSFPGSPCYDGTLFIGNSNGTLYCLDATGVLDDPFNGISPNDLNTRRFSLDPTTPTVDVKWWFNTGAAIAYAPAYEPKNGEVLVTTYDPNSNNHGRLFAIKAALGPLGNAGKGTISSGVPVPQSYNYNLTPVSYWSFPDAYGALPTVGSAFHVRDPNVTTTKPALPLGDIAGAPTVESIDSSGATHVMICANEPGPPGAEGNATLGRVYSLNVDSSGSFDWAWPNTGGNPSNVVDAASYGSVFTFGSVATSSGTQPLTIGSFTQNISDLGLTVSSSVVTGLITFPAALPTAQSSLADTQVPMAYVGNLDGSVYALNLNGSDDASRFIYKYSTRDGTPVYSTPALLPGSANKGGTGSGSPEVGGVLFITTAGQNLVEIEATPYVFGGNTYVNTDFQYSGVGGISSPCSAAFDVTPFSNSTLGLKDSTGSAITRSASAGPFVTSEWVYAGSDTGYCYAFTPNSVSGGGSSFAPSDFIPPASYAPPDQVVDLTRNFISRIVASNTPNPASNLDYNSTLGPPANPVFDWGQTVYIQIYGTDPSSAPAAPHPAYPRAISVSFTLSQVGPGGKPIHTQLRSISLQGKPNAIAVNFPPSGLASQFPQYTGAANDYYNVATYPYVLGNGINDAETPGTKIRVANIKETVMVDSSGRTQVVQGGIDAGTVYGSAATGLKATTPIDQATFTILNPLAVSGAGKSVDGQSTHTINIAELGPYAGIAKNDSSTFSVWQDAAANGNYIPDAPPLGGTFGGGTSYDPTALGSIAGSVTKTTYKLVAVDVGEVLHGQSADTGSGQGDAPVLNASTYQSPSQTSPTHPHGKQIGSSYGPSLFLLADRSALGSKDQYISRLRIDALKLGWNDNTGQGGPGSAVNMLSWDTPPLAYDYGSANTSRDYPDMPKSGVNATLEQRNSSLGGINHNQAGSSARIDNTSGTLPPSDGGSDSGDSGGTRNIYPAGTLVKVTAPKYQAANLEAYHVDSGGITLDAPRSRKTDGTGTPIVGADMPQGYVATARIFVDSNGNGRLDPGEAYRTVQVWVGVPVDMGMSIDEPALDIGTVPAGFGDQVVDSGGASAWAPFYDSDSQRNPALASASPFAAFFRPYTVHNNGNVNLLNVHMDQLIGGPYDFAAGKVTSPTDTNGNPIAPYLSLISDQNETPSFALDPVTGWPYWNSSLSYIPTIDNKYGLMLNSNSSASGYLVRSSIDPDVYTPNPNEYDLAGNAPGPSRLYNATLHKARAGDAASTTLTVPDEPLDSYNPASMSITNPSFAPVYAGQPRLSVAVPIGTPSGSYYGTIRAFEGADPYAATPQNGVSTVFNGPAYYNATHAASAYNPNNIAFTIANGGPLQYFTEPGTKVKITVSESRLTDNVPLRSNGRNMTLAELDAAAPMVNSTTGDIVPTNDLQPAAFPYYGAGSITSTSPTYGMLFISNRLNASASNPTAGSGYDLFSTAMAPALGTGQSPLTVPTGGASNSWWTAPHHETNVGSTGASVRNPYVLSDGFDPVMAFYVGSTLTASGTTYYTIYERDVNSLSATGISMANAPGTALYTSSSPIFGIKCVIASDNINGTLGSKHLIVFWHTRSRGRSSILYGIVDLDSGGKIALDTSNNPVASSAQILPVSNALSEVSSPAPQLRVISQYNGSSGSGGAFTPDPDGGAPSSNFIITPTNANAIDVTYSGVSAVTSDTDIYTSRYVLKPAVTGANAAPATLARVPLIAANGDSSATKFSPSSAAVLATKITLQRSAGDPSLFIAPDVDWLVDPSYITITYPEASGGSVIDTAIVGSLVTPHYLYDKASGQLVYTVALPWDTSGRTDSVYINPAQGTVRFSVAPPSASSTSAIKAIVTPLSSRVTMSTRVNTEPIALMDEFLKPNAPGESGTGSTVEPTFIPAPVHASREWFLYRRSGTTTGDASAVNSTLYYNTRRLTVDLAHLDTQYQTSSLHMAPGQKPAGHKVLDTVGFQVLASGSSAMTSSIDVTNRVDIDWARARINFPSYMEGLWVTVTYHNQNYGGDINAGTSPPGTGKAISVGPVQLTWKDEPYVNAFNPSQSVVGERTVPMTTAINESNPAAFLDPGSGVNTVSGTTITTPHRLWLFWSSTRNASPQVTQVGAKKAQGTGSDIYYEWLDPRFSVSAP